MTKWIDLNADLGEGEATDAAIMELISSCNIACGGHTGDAASMRAALLLAKDKKVAAGAHPSYPDREGFGRRSTTISNTALESALTQQVDELKAEAAKVGVRLSHLKPHGALYNDAAKDAGLANIVAKVTFEGLPNARLVGPPNSQLGVAAKDYGLAYTAEGFADRAYTSGGVLVSRNQPGAILSTDAARTAQALQIATTQTVTSHTGAAITLPATSLCLHGDSFGALSSARAIRAELEAAGLTIRAPQ